MSPSAWQRKRQGSRPVLPEPASIRVVGDPKLAVHDVAALWGNVAQMPAIQLLNTDIDVLVGGYARGWEAVEYALDMIAAGGKKGLILLGEAASVDFGMKYCAEWIATFVEKVPVEFIPSRSPYWGIA